MQRDLIVATLLGIAQGAAGCTTLFLLSDRYTLAKDWFLAVMILFATTSSLILAAWYQASKLGVALAGLVGLFIGGWLGSNIIGNYEYTVPRPKEEKEIKILVPGKKERVIELKGMPDEKVKVIPIGAGLGALAGWLFGAGVYAWLYRPEEEEEKIGIYETNHPLSE